MSDASAEALRAFLLARIDEDEAPARQMVDEARAEWVDTAAPWAVSIGQDEGYDALSVPAKRWLDDCASQRALVEAHRQQNFGLHVDGGTPADRCVECRNSRWPCRTLRLLALPYAAHPEYRSEEWRP